MAEHLASIYGTEKDKVNCSFYFKIGACRHGERCSRKHVKPTFSPTILLPNMYHNPAHDPTSTYTPQQLQQHFDLFYDDVFTEMCSFGQVEEMYVCDNVGDHLVGNVYIRFFTEEEAGRAVEALNRRFYAGRPLYAELSPVTDFNESCCRQHEMNECTRGGFCNFMHFRRPTASLVQELEESQNAYLWEKQQHTERSARGESTGVVSSGKPDAELATAAAPMVSATAAVDDRPRERYDRERYDRDRYDRGGGTSGRYDDRRRRRDDHEDERAVGNGNGGGGFYDKRRRYEDDDQRYARR